MKRIINTTFLFIAATMIIIACQHKNDTPVPSNPTGNNNGGNNGGNGGGGNGGGGNGGGGNNNNDTGICFTRDILPIFISNCAKAGCHDAASRQDGFEFTSYETIIAKEFVPGNAEATELYEKITEDRADKIMPPPPAAPLTTEQKELIKRWINEGAKNTTCNSGSGCDTNNFKYSTAVKVTMDKYCKGCHNASSAPKGIALDTYSGVASAANSGALLGALRHEAGYTPMPQGGNKLSDCEITQIEKWIAEGTPND